ncbi:MAG TPA: carboxypeptidase regulatory-like domain-containing protein, partial [Pyrinomonadaceae bacterium]|nr:carboxypeptidase regulatory-like domain-containing protein [Pyrinomonadaceae bacterium]
QILPIRRVILYSNGVAYIERRGMVSGHAEIDLSFKQSQVDDVLKSMVVLDLGQGRIGAVSYNSSAPPAARVADIPFSIEAGTASGSNGGLAGVLSQLQGARVVVATANRTVTGSILTIEERKSQIDADKPAQTTHALVIASESGELMSFDLADVRSIKLIDEGTRRDVTEFANATASARRRDAKTIVVTSDGAGSREMLVSYTIAAPIWKTTYRVVLDSTGKPFFQGWAIVDNVSEEDWNNISLSLVSGSPVSFIQPIQKPFYRYRPVVGMPEDLKLSPQTYEDNEGGTPGTVSGRVTDRNGAAIANASVQITNTTTNQTYETTTSSDGVFQSPTVAAGNYTVTINASGFKRTRIINVNIAGSAPTYANATLEVGNVQETVTVTGGAERFSNYPTPRHLKDLPISSRTVNGLYSTSPGLTNNFVADGTSLSDAITRPDSGVEAVATGSEVGDLFEYRIDQPVTVPRDRSALIPILQTRMEGERVSIYNEGNRRDRAMGGMLLKNTSSLTLEGGALTVIDGDAYAGEALIERLKPGEQRLISFALDLGTLVNASTKEDRAPAFLVRAINGVFQAHYYQTSKKAYTLTNQTDKSRVVFVEHPVRQDWTLTDDTPKPDGKTARYYRFRVPLGPHQKVELPVTERRALMDSYALTTFSRPDLELFIARNYIDAATRATLEKILDLKSRMTMADSRIEAIDKEVVEIGEDQGRLRDNIKALTATAEAKQLISRYVAKADTQETRLEQLNKDKKTLYDERAGLQGELETMIRGLAIDRKLDR